MGSKQFPITWTCTYCKRWNGQCDCGTGNWIKEAFRNG